MSAGRATLSDRIADTLKRQILEGSYRPGQKLPAEPALADALQVNRFTVREALKELEKLGLIERRAGVGTVVLDYAEHASFGVIEHLVLDAAGRVNTKVLADLLETTRILSAEIATLAAERRTHEDLRTVEVLVAKMKSENNLSRLFWLDFDLNWALAGAARNVVPRLFLNSVRGLLEKYTHLLETLWVSPGSITEGYDHVLDAIRAKDPERARALMKWIWTGRHQRFVEAAERRSRPPSPAQSA